MAERLWRALACAAMLIIGGTFSPTMAQEQVCKPDLETAEGGAKFRPLSKDKELAGRGAAMKDAVAKWRISVRAKWGERFSDWSKAKDTTVECTPTMMGSLVSCTISGRPCRASMAADKVEAAPPPSPQQQPQPPSEARRRGAVPKTAANYSCVALNVCTPVQIFFGTDRNRKDKADRIAFGEDRARRLQLGSAIVTVPRGRKVGEIPRPGWWDRWVRGVSEAGDPTRHFTIPPGGIKIYGSAGEFITAIKGQEDGLKDDALVFVHGYNVKFDDALYRSAQISYDLSTDGINPFGTAFLYSWPSSGETRGYKYDAESAEFAVGYVEEFLEMVTQRTGAKNVHIIAHSMGSVPVLMALDRLRSRLPTDPRIKSLVFAAPDFDASEFERVASRIRSVTGTATLYASSKDVAMKIARGVHLGYPRAGDVPASGRPVIVPHVDSIDISAISTDVLALAHSEYSDRKELLNDIAMLFRKGDPPNLRNINFKQQGKGDAIWWKYAE